MARSSTAPLLPTRPQRHRHGPRATHLWPQQLSSSRFGSSPSELIDYTPTERLLVVEVMCALEHGLPSGGGRDWWPLSSRDRSSSSINRG
jgi:hypothetical protein